ncbi:hypothetical protein OE88DRAFT_1649467 [Heliocybe sulcata]|uniref:Uncharacterized protein n=1 Tax=Heliocybe sulcata TaxID=5364 RepID=A0A5C3MMM2_9AGAM|nr:hypothetical protein OE88DRAFT_1649467 [Heliocybe sulcata]
MKSQVCNISNSIKVALDFLSVADLPPTECVGQELRIQRIITDWGEDVLHFYDVLWYAWLSLSQQMKFRGNAVIDYACDPTDDVITDPEPMLVDQEEHPTSSGADHKIEKRMQKRKERRIRRKAQQKQAPRSSQPDRDFLCPVPLPACERMGFGQTGLVHHLVEKHKLCLEKGEARSLRMLPKKEFLESLHAVICRPS